MRNHFQPWFRSTVRVLEFYGDTATFYGFAEIRCEKPGYNCVVK